MLLSASFAAPAGAEMPTTKVGKPAVCALATDMTAPGESSIAVLPLAGQFGWPSVASRMNFGFEIGQPC